MSRARELADSYTDNEVDSKPTGFKNYIINGAFDVWQRGTTGTTGYIADRFANASGVTASSLVASGLSEFPNCLSITGTTGNITTVQKIEQVNINKLNGKQVTVSFWMRQTVGSSSGLMNVLTPTVKDNYSAITVDSYDIGIVPSTWTKYTQTFTVTQDMADYGLGISVGVNPASNNTIQLTGMQLEEGSVATPFENRPIGLELSLCQRYYERLTNINTPFIMYTPNGDTRVSIPFKVQKRMVPECTISGAISSLAVGTSGNATNMWLTISSVGEKTVDGIYSIMVTNPSVLQHCGVIAAGQGHCELTATANSEL